MRRSQLLSFRFNAKIYLVQSYNVLTSELLSFSFLTFLYSSSPSNSPPPPWMPDLVFSVPPPPSSTSSIIIVRLSSDEGSTNPPGAVGQRGQRPQRAEHQLRDGRVRHRGRGREQGGGAGQRETHRGKDLTPYIPKCHISITGVVGGGGGSYAFFSSSFLNIVGTVNSA